MNRSSVTYDYSLRLSFSDMRYIRDMDKVVSMTISRNEDLDSLESFASELTNLKRLKVAVTRKVVNIPYLPSLEDLHLVRSTAFSYGELIISDKIEHLNRLKLTKCALSRLAINNMSIDLLTLDKCGLFAFYYQEVNMVKDAVNVHVKTVSINRSYYGCHDFLGNINAENLLVSEMRELALATFVPKKICFDKFIVFSVTTINSIKGVEELVLESVPLTSIDFLREFRNLKVLNISYTKVNDLSPLEGLDLYSLEADRIPARNFGVISSMTNIEELALRYNKIKDIGFLKGLKHLKTLCLGNNEIVHIDPLSTCTSLRKLNLSHNPIFDIECLEACRNLISLKIYHTLVFQYDTDKLSCRVLPEIDSLCNRNTIKETVDSLSGDASNIDYMDTAIRYNEVVKKIMLTREPTLLEDTSKLPVLRYIEENIIEAEEFKDLLSRVWSMIEEHEQSDILFGILNGDLKKPCPRAMTCRLVSLVATFFDGYALEEDIRLTICKLLLEAFDEEGDDKLIIARRKVAEYYEYVKYLC